MGLVLIHSLARAYRAKFAEWDWKKRKEIELGQEE
jgi:hypothetical protein